MTKKNKLRVCDTALAPAIKAVLHSMCIDDIDDIDHYAMARCEKLLAPALYKELAAFMRLYNGYTHKSAKETPNDIAQEAALALNDLGFIVTSTEFEMTEHDYSVMRGDFKIDKYVGPTRIIISAERLI